MAVSNTVIVVYVSMFLDNLLLTVVVPIIPDYLFSGESTASGHQHPQQHQSDLLQHKHSGGGGSGGGAEAVGGRVGALLSAKALVQLAANPIVGHLSRFTGYNLPLFFGSVCLLASSLLFALGEGYGPLLVARSLHGVASSCVGVAGMCAVARGDRGDEEARSRVMGAVLGSVALGVLLGYPTGGLLYSALGKLAPFLLITTLTIFNLVFQLSKVDLKTHEVAEREAEGGGGWGRLLRERVVVLSAGAICLSSSALAILEPCLPLWLMDRLKPQKWELGTVFIPDSLGYLIGTNGFGVIAYRLGRCRVSIAAMILLGVSATLVPGARSVSGLAVPHLCLGLAVGVVDAALVPLLATVVDRTGAPYSTVYSLQQTAVSLAYALGPVVGGELVESVGFPWLMRAVGLVNLLYSPLLLLLTASDHPHTAPQEEKRTGDGEESGLVSYGRAAGVGGGVGYQRMCE